MSSSSTRAATAAGRKKQPLAVVPNLKQQQNTVVSSKKSPQKSVDQKKKKKAAIDEIMATAAVAPHQPKSSAPNSERTIPMVVFEKLEAHQRFYVNLNSIYSGGKEFQVEEIRAREWYNKRERELERDRTQKLEQEVQLLKQQLQQLQASLGKRPITPRTPLNTKLSASSGAATGGSKLRDPDRQIVAAAVSGVLAHNHEPDFEIFEDTSTQSVPVPVPKQQVTKSALKPLRPHAPALPAVVPPANFEIFTDPTDQITVPCIPPPNVKIPAVSKFEIFQDPPTSTVNPSLEHENGSKKRAVLRQLSPAAINKESLQSPVSSSQELEDRMDTLFDFSINPVGHPNGRRVSDFTLFHIPSETEFLDRPISCSTPSAAGAAFIAANKKAIPRLAPSRNQVQLEQQVEQQHKEQQQQALQRQQELQNELTTGNCGLTGPLKLDTIVETSREYKSSSSSSGSSAQTTRAMHSTNSTSKTMSATCAAISQRTRFLSGGSSQDKTTGDGQNGYLVIIPDPFDVKLISSLMDELPEPIDRRKGFKFISKNLPKIRESMTKLPLGQNGDKYIVQELKDEGAYAKVYAAQIETNEEDNTGFTGSTSTMGQTAISDLECFNKFYALKISKPANMWEFYIVDELHKRLQSKTGIDIELSVQMGNPAVMYKDASVLVDEYCSNGTLMKIVNVYKKNKKSFPKSMTAYFALELMLIIKQMHECDIIHADIKPDNVLLLNFPTKEEVMSVIRRTSAIKLIDFGRAIDMSLFPKETMFMHHIETRGSACPEMHDSLPWSYQIDWFGFLDCLHILIFQEYIDIGKDSETGKWFLQKKVNKRNHLKDLWEPLFDQLLNLQQVVLQTASEQQANSNNTNNNQSSQHQNIVKLAASKVVDEAITSLTSYTTDHLDEIYRESMEMEAFFERAKHIK